MADTASRVQRLLAGDMMSGESVLWSGQPDPGVWLSSADLFLIPFSLMWGGFAYFWEYSVVMQYLKAPPQNREDILFMVIFGLAFVVMGTYFIVGRFFFKAFNKRKTYYAITNKRVLVINTLFGQRTLQSVYLDKLPEMHKSVRSDGIGSIVFGTASSKVMAYQNSGMDFFSGRSGLGIPLAFYDVPRIDQVYALILKQVESAKKEVGAGTIPDNF